MQSLSAYSRENSIGRDAANDFLNEAIGEQRSPVKAHFNVMVWTESKDELKELKNDSLQKLSGSISVIPFLVPHRDEFSETVGFKIITSTKKYLFIPDIDKWEKWDKSFVDEIQKVAHKIISENPKKVILFHGNMGVGKTTLIKELAIALGVFDATSSPTFSLVNEYQTSNNQLVYHFDMYRINSEREALDMGIDEYLYSGNWCFIEWAEKIPNLIPEEHSVIRLSLTSDGKRHLTLL